MNFAVLQFPASNCDQDAVHAARLLGHSARLIWHKDSSLGAADAVIVLGGFSYGDYLRCGAIARFSPVMQAVKQFADNGGLVLGICNGFQVLCEAHLLPGALIRNRSLQFRCEQIFLKTVAHDSPFTSQIPAGKVLRVPIAHGEGCYFADADALAQLRRIARPGSSVFIISKNKGKPIACILGSEGADFVGGWPRGRCEQNGPVGF